MPRVKKIIKEPTEEVQRNRRGRKPKKANFDEIKEFIDLDTVEISEYKQQEPSDESYFFEMRTDRCRDIKLLFECLGEFLVDITLEIYDNRIEIRALRNKAQSKNASAFCAQLFAKNFLMYYFNPVAAGVSDDKPHRIRINIDLINNRIKSAIGEISFALSSDYPDQLILKIDGLIIRGIRGEYRIALISSDEFKLKDAEHVSAVIDGILDISNYPVHVKTMSSLFHQICKDIGKMQSESLQIVYYQDKIYYKQQIDNHNVGEICQVQDAEHTRIEKKPDDESLIVSGTFSTSSINSYNKFSYLSNNIRLYMSNAKPYIIEYSVGTTGKIMISL
jgi:hypothetical protein